MKAPVMKLQERVELRPEWKLLRGAARLIAQHGLAKLTSRDLARESHTSNGRLGEFFEDRDDLSAFVFDGGWTVIGDGMTARLLEAGSRPEDRILALVEGLIDAYETDRDLVSAAIILGSVTLGLPVRARLRATPGFQRYRAITRDIADQYKREGLPDEIADELEHLLFGAITRRLLVETEVYANDREGGTRGFNRDALRRTLKAMLGGLDALCAPKNGDQR